MLSPQLYGQAQGIFYSNYTVNDGLVSNYVYDILQDQDGYIWFATESGVNKYDGYRFERFTTENGLPANEVLKMYEDQKGRIWFLSYSGSLSYYWQGILYNAENCPLLKALLQGNNVYFMSHIFEDDTHNIWITGVKGNTYQINENDSIVRVIPNVEGGQKVFGYQNEQGGVNLFGRQRLISIYNDSISIDLHSHPKPSGRCGLYIGNDSIICHTNDSLLLHFDGKFTVIHSHHDIPAMKTPITFIEKDEQHHYWVGTHSGLFEFDQSFQLINSFLKNEIVSNVICDQEGNYWISTLGKGIFFTPNIDTRYASMAQGLANNEIVSLATDSESRTWIGYIDGTIDVLHPNREIDRNLLLEKEHSGRRRILGFRELSDGQMLVWADHLLAICNENETSVLSKGIRAACVDEEESQIYGVEMGTLRIIKLQRTRHSTSFEMTDISMDGNFYAIESYGDSFLVGGVNGVQVWDGSKLDYLIPDVPELRHRVTAIKVAPDQSLWIATHDIGVIHILEDEIHVIDKSSGLASNLCKALVLADNNHIWVGTSDGLCLIKSNRGTYDINTYTARDGLSSNEINAVALRNDEVIVGTMNGISIFDWKTYQSNNKVPRIHLTRFLINGREVDFAAPILLEHNENDIAFDFVGLSYQSLGDIQYRYRLLGADSVWRYTLARSVEFPNLPPGQYAFEVQAANSTGNWTVTKHPALFSIQLPWWDTWWFAIMMQLIALTILVGIFTAILKNHKKRNQLLWRAQEAEQSALRAQMSPHFLFNALNTIQHFIITNNKEAAYRFLEKFGSLIRTTLHSSRKQFIPLEEEIAGLNRYLELEEQRFEHKIEHTFKIDPTLDASNLAIPPMLIQPLVENSLRHGLALNKSKGRIIVSFKRKRDQLHIEVFDNGIGRSAALQFADAKAQNNLGLDLTRERLEILSAQENEKFELRIVDHLDEEGNGSGTTVHLNLPFREVF